MIRPIRVDHTIFVKWILKLIHSFLFQSPIQGDSKGTTGIRREFTIDLITRDVPIGIITYHTLTHIISQHLYGIITSTIKHADLGVFGLEI